jgi:site-specific DNA recombinase
LPSEGKGRTFESCRARQYNSERERLAGDAAAVRARLKAKRDRIEGERQRNIDLVIKYVISEEDAS